MCILYARKIRSISSGRGREGEERGFEILGMGRGRLAPTLCFHWATGSTHSRDSGSAASQGFTYQENIRYILQARCPRHMTRAWYTKKASSRYPIGSESYKYQIRLSRYCKSGL